MTSNFYFLESSAFTKRYTRESGSNFMDQLFLSNNHTFFYLSIAYCEILKVFYRLYKYPQQNENKITENEFNILCAKLSEDLLISKRIALTDEIINKSREILSVGYLKSSIDILHIAGFLVTKDFYNDLILVTADNDLSEVAMKFTNMVINLNGI